MRGEIKDLSSVRGASHPAFAAAASSDDEEEAVRGTLERLQGRSAVAPSEVSEAPNKQQGSAYAARVRRRAAELEGDGIDGYKERMGARAKAAEAEKDSKVDDDLESDEPRKKKRRRWDVGADDDGNAQFVSSTEADVSSAAETGGKPGATRRRRRFDAAPEDVESIGKMDQDHVATETASLATIGTLASSATKWEQEVSRRNLPLSEAELDAILPSEGYEIVRPPPGYEPAGKRAEESAKQEDEEDEGMDDTDTVSMMVTDYGELVTPDGVSLPAMKLEDQQFFGKLMENVDESSMTAAQKRDRKISLMLLRIKNGNPPQRKVALRQITKQARELGAGPLFQQILPLLMSPTLEPQERHYLVKVIDRILYRLDELVRPYVHKILVVIEPMLIEEDQVARVEGREIIANLAKAAGLPTMVAAMRPDIDHTDDFVRNTTARALAVVASALGIPSMVPFLKAVCASKKSWQARHTGAKIVQQIAVLIGFAVLPHLTSLVEIVGNGLKDQNQAVRTITALALAALAESSHPFGIESFDSVLEPLWRGVRSHHGKTLAAFLKAIGCIIPLFDDNDYAEYFAKEVMVILIREFKSPDDEMRKVCLRVMRQCIASDGVKSQYLRESVCPEFFRNFWVRRMAQDWLNTKEVIETTVNLAGKIGAGEVIEHIVDDLKDENEAYRRMVMRAVSEIVKKYGTSSINERLETRLVDGALYCFQEQGVMSAQGISDSVQAERDVAIIINGFTIILVAFDKRSKVYLPQIAGTLKFRLNSKDSAVRGQAAELAGKIAPVMKTCDEDSLMAHLGVVLYENLGEEFPAVLASILGGLTGIVNSIGMTAMQPPIKDLLPRVTPILKNQNEKVQENAIALVGRIAARCPDQVIPREWMRICFELIDMLGAKRKSIRKASVAAFGHIAQAIGPQDITHALLNNLKVQGRSSRVCSTVGLAVVADSCGPFAVIPALLTDYRVPDSNVQHGVLKTLSFLFQYIGPAARDYTYAVVSLIEDALCQRDAVHRQIASTVVKHLALGVQGAGCEDALVHMLNFVWPNIFEESPHVISAVLEAVEAIRVSLGAQHVFMYVLQGLFHPARRVRETYWRIYNNLYIYSGEALVPALPTLDPDFHGCNPEKKEQVLNTLSKSEQERTIRNNYQRTHLELFI